MRYHFITGLPRAGSTLLVSILNQNPKFKANTSNPLARFVRAIVSESYASPGYHLQCPELKRLELVRGLIENYHSHLNCSVAFNTSRDWSSLLPLIEKVSPCSKVICCVRDVRWVLDSFEVLFRKNPFTVSRLYGEKESETVYTRTYSLMSPGHIVRFAYDSLKEALTGNQKHLLFVLDYEQLARDPEAVMKSLHRFIDEPYYLYDFENVYDDEHSIRKKVEYVERLPILPPDLWNEFRGLEVWK